MTMLTRSLPCEEVRAAEDAEDDRTFDFVAVTENPIDMGWGREVIRIGGMDLDRYRSNPVVLNAHNRHDVRDIVGQTLTCSKGKTKEGRRCLDVRIRFTEATEAGAATLALVREGSLKTLSIGYRVMESRELAEGESDGRGDHLIEGPAYVADKSELLEVSTVPVPADPGAVKRAYMEAREEPAADPPSPPEPAEPTATEPAAATVVVEVDLDAIVPVEEELEAQLEKQLALLRRLTSDPELLAHGEHRINEDPELDVLGELRPELRSMLLKRARPVGTPPTSAIKLTTTKTTPEPTEKPRALPTASDLAALLKEG